MRSRINRPIGLLILGGLSSACIHDPWLRSECKRVRVGMHYREVYRIVGSGTQYCQFKSPKGGVNDAMTSCWRNRPDAIPVTVSWEIPVTFSVQPDQCRVEFDPDGKATFVQY